MSLVNQDSALFDGRPKCHNRIEKEELVYDLLEQLSIPFKRVDHAPAYTIEDCNGVDRLLGIKICKNLFLCTENKAHFYLLLMPGDKKFKTKEVSKQIGSSRLSFANETYLESLLHLTPGSVTILGLMNDTKHQVQLLIDRDLLDQEYLGCHPCINTSSLKFKTTDILEKFLPFTGHSPIYVTLSE